MLLVCAVVTGALAPSLYLVNSIVGLALVFAVLGVALEPPFRGAIEPHGDVEGCSSTCYTDLSIDYFADLLCGAANPSEPILDRLG